MLLDDSSEIVNDGIVGHLQFCQVSDDLLGYFSTLLLQLHETCKGLLMVLLHHFQIHNSILQEVRAGQSRLSAYARKLAVDFIENRLKI